MEQRAEAMGANAVVGVDIDYEVLGADNGMNLVKLYPEGNAETRFKRNRTKKLYCYCNKHGLFEQRIIKKR